MQRYLLLLIVLLTPQLALAHLVSTRFGEFYNGMLHPVISMVHIIPWLGLALLAGLQSQQHSRYSMLVFPIIILCSALLGSQLPSSSFVENINSLSFIVIGLLLALARPIAMRWFLLLCSLLALSHGYANGFQLSSTNQQLLYVAGVTSTAYITVTVFAALAVKLKEYRWGTIALRALGSWIVAIGLIYNGFTWLSLG